MGLTIWLYCIFGNESQLMPYFLRHYAPLVDRLIMLDAGSTDGSADMVRACPNAMVKPCEVGHTMDAAIVAEYSSYKVREARGPADYVIWVDCDEFIYSPIDLHELLRGYKAQSIRAVKAFGYQMLADEFVVSDGRLTDLVRQGVRDREYDKMAVFDSALDVEWSPGHHNYNIKGVTAYQCDDVKLLHYRYFGEHYTITRNARNYTRISAAEIEARRGYHVYPDYKSGKYSLDWFKKMQTVAVDAIEARP